MVQEDNPFWCRENPVPAIAQSRLLCAFVQELLCQFSRDSPVPVLSQRVTEQVQRLLPWDVEVRSAIIKAKNAPVITSLSRDLDTLYAEILSCAITLP